MAIRQGLSAGRMFNTVTEGMQRSDSRVVQNQLNGRGRHLDAVAGVQGTARYPMRMGKPLTTFTAGAYILTPAGGTITFVGDYFDRLSGVYASPQGATTSLSSTVIDEQHLQVVFDVCSSFGQIDVYFYDNLGLWFAGNAVTAQMVVRAFRVQPLEQQGATLCYRAPNFSIASGTCTWFSSERANGDTKINYFPATGVSSTGPTQSGTIGGAPIFNATSTALTNADLMANWLGTGAFYVQAVVDLVAVTSTVNGRSAEAIICDSNGNFALGFYSNGGTWTATLNVRTSVGGYSVNVALPSNSAQRVIVQARMNASGVLAMRVNNGAWTAGNTASSTTLSTGGSLIIGTNYQGTAHFQGTIWFVATYNFVPADSTFCDLMYATHNVNYPPTPIKLLDLDSRFLSVSAGQVTSWLDQSGNGWDATLTSGATKPAYNAAWTSAIAPSGYNGLPAVQYANNALECHETSDAIATSIGKNPITIFVVGHVDQSLSTSNPTGDQYFVMTKSGRPAGVSTHSDTSWAFPAGLSAPSATPVTPNRRSMICAVLTQGDSTRVYLNSKLPATFGKTDPITNYTYITNNLTFDLGANTNDVYGSNQGETNRTLRGGGWLDTGITAGFRIGNYQTLDTAYSPAGVILRVIVYLGALTQQQVESVLGTLETTYGVLVEDEVANEASIGITGAWDAGLEFSNWTDSNLNSTNVWLGKSTRGFTNGQNYTAASGDNAAPATINSKKVPPLGSHSYIQSDTYIQSLRTLGATFARDGTAGSIIIALNANSLQAPLGGTLVDAAILGSNGGTLAIEHTTSGVRAVMAGIATAYVAAPAGTNLIVLVTWDGVNLKIAVNATSGVITWTSAAVAGGLGYVSGTLQLGANYNLSQYADQKVGAIRTYRKALTDAQFNAEAVPIQTLLGWSNGFQVGGNNYSKNISESITLMTLSWTRSTVNSRPLAEAFSAPTDAAARAMVQVRALPEAATKPTDAVVRSAPLARAVADSTSAPTDAAARAVAMTRAIGEAILAVVDAAARAWAATRAVADAVVKPTDAVGRTWATTRAIADATNAPSDAVARALVDMRAVPETVSAPTDAAARTVPASRTLADNVPAPTDAPARVATAVRLVADSTSAPTEALARALAEVRALVEPLVAPTDTATRSGQLARAVTDGLSAPTDAAARAAVQTRLLTEATAALTDTVARAWAAGRPLAEAVTKPTDALVRALVTARTVAESRPLPTDSVARVLVAVRALAEALAAPTDLVTRAGGPNIRPIPETTLAPTDAAARASVAARAVADATAAPTDAATRRAVQVRALPESIVKAADAIARRHIARRITLAESTTKPADAVTRRALLLRLLVDSITTPTDSVSRATSRATDIAEAVSLSEQIDRSTVQVREKVEVIPAVLDAVVRQADLSRSVFDAVARARELTVVQQVSQGRAIYESLFVSDIIDDRVVAARSLAESITKPTDAVAVLYVRQPHYIFESTALTEQLNRKIDVTRHPDEARAQPFDTAARRTVVARAIAQPLGAPTDVLVRPRGVRRAVVEALLKPTDVVVGARSPHVRAVADALLAPSMGVARAAVLARALGEATAKPLDAPVRARAFNKALTEAVLAPSVTAARKAVQVRLMAEMLATSDTPARVAAHARALGEAPAAPHDALVRAGMFLASVQEGIFAPSDGTITRATTAARAMAEVLRVTDTLVRPRDAHRSMTEALVAPSDAVAMLVVVWSTVHNPGRITYDLGPQTVIEFTVPDERAKIVVLPARPKSLIDITQGPKARITMSHLGMFDVGDVAEIQFAVSTRLTGVLGDPSQLTATTMHRDTGVKEVITYDANVGEHRLVRDGQGKYRLLLPITLDMVGDWIVEIKASGGIDAMQPTTFRVRAPLIPA